LRSVTEESDATVTLLAEQTTDFSASVAVVNVEISFLATDSAFATLLFNKVVVMLLGNAVVVSQLQVSSPTLGLLAFPFSSAGFDFCWITFGVLPLDGVVTLTHFFCGDCFGVSADADS
jgi:hypothetical protein